MTFSDLRDRAPPPEQSERWQRGPSKHPAQGEAPQRDPEPLAETPTSWQRRMARNRLKRSFLLPAHQAFLWLKRAEAIWQQNQRAYRASHPGHRAQQDSLGIQGKDCRNMVMTTTTSGRIVRRSQFPSYTLAFKKIYMSLTINNKQSYKDQTSMKSLCSRWNQRNATNHPKVSTNFIFSSLKIQRSFWVHPGLDSSPWKR